MKSSTSESKPLQSRSKGKIIGQARRKEQLSSSKLKQVFLIDSDDKLFLYLIRCIRLGSWLVRRLNWALVQLNPQLKDPSKLLLIYMYSCYGDFIPIEVWTPRRGTQVKFNAPFIASSPKRHPVQHSKCRKLYPVQRHIHCTDPSQIKERPPLPRWRPLLVECRVDLKPHSLTSKQTSRLWVQLSLVASWD